MRLQWVDVGAGRQRLVDIDFKTPEDRATTTRETLTAKERRSLRIRFGKDFKTESELRSHMKANDLRFLEKGERQDRAKRMTKEWLRDTKPGERGKCPMADATGYIRG